MVGKWRMKVDNDFVVINPLIEVLKLNLIAGDIYIYNSSTIFYAHDNAGLSGKIVKEINWQI